MNKLEEFNNLIDKYRFNVLNDLKNDNFHTKDEAEQFANLIYYMIHLHEAIKQHTLDDPQKMVSLLYSISSSDNPSEIMTNF